jgi:hypothetical protein
VAPFRGWLEAPDALLPAIQENPWRSHVELFLYLAASAAALPAASRIAYSQSHPAGQLPPAAIRPLAERLAAYVDGLRYEDIDAATVERVKTHVIDVIGCGIGAFDERPVGICREVALAVGGKATIIGTDRRTSWRLLPTEPPSATSTSTTPIPDAFPSTQATTSRPVCTRCADQPRLKIGHSGLCAALDRHHLLGIEPVVDPISPMLHQLWA